MSVKPHSYRWAKRTFLLVCSATSLYVSSVVDIVLEGTVRVWRDQGSCGRCGGYSMGLAEAVVADGELDDG